MIKQISDKLRGFWHVANNWALAMDVDPLEDIHHRVRRLETAVFQSEVRPEPAVVPDRPRELEEAPLDVGRSMPP
jgi:hypothetical protein